ncbi:MAG TPA: hypothetical protein VMF30_07160, partial [Pirellulales bacterium]|nr:hypothetical protein [Pirellulales bacterium]
MAGVRVDVVRAFVLWLLALGLALAIAVRAEAQGILGPPPVNRMPSTGPALTTGPREGSTPQSAGGSTSGTSAGPVGSYAP